MTLPPKTRMSRHPIARRKLSPGTGGLPRRFSGSTGSPRTVRAAELLNEEPKHSDTHQPVALDSKRRRMPWR